MSNVLSQKDAVYAAILSVYGEIRNNKCELSKEQKANVVGIVTQGIMAGQVEFSDRAKATHDTEEKVTEYVGGMVGNWLRKDTRLNGGVEHQIKNPGSRSFSNNPEVANLRKFIKNLEAEGNMEAADEARTYLAAKLEELKAARPTKATKTQPINADLIPEDLKHLIKQ